MLKTRATLKIMHHYLEAIAKLQFNVTTKARCLEVCLTSCIFLKPLSQIWIWASQGPESDNLTYQRKKKQHKRTPKPQKKTPKPNTKNPT